MQNYILLPYRAYKTKSDLEGLLQFYFESLRLYQNIVEYTPEYSYVATSK